jgi:hypothetical protein
MKKTGWRGNLLLLPSFLNLINIFGQLEPNDLLYYSLFVHQSDQKHFARFTFSNYNSSYRLLQRELRCRVNDVEVKKKGFIIKSKFKNNPIV